ncbi:MAG: response regulator transcription factor [Mucilaginibacter polytrichastri]|nr:response regulator transcription factor [Mucilaginibacter polytrichastri]
MNILLVEDEPGIASVIQRGLSDEGHKVSIAMDGKTGLDMAQRHGFDVLIMDVMLPQMNGVDVCRNLRAQKVQTPVLMLTALGTTENVVTGLDSGADDYMVKPFKLAELSARLRSLTRRNPAAEPGNTLHIGDLLLDDDAKTVTRRGQAIALTATEFRLLFFLLKNQGRVLSRIQILDNVWDIDFNMGTNVVDVYINYLRNKVDKPFDQKLIHTVVGMGYVMKEE